MKFCRPLAFTIALLFSGIANAQSVPLGIWSWKQDSITTKTSRAKLLKFCKKEGISHIDQHVSMRRQDGLLQIVNANKLAMLVQEAAALDITVAALRGDRKMFAANNHDARLDEVAALIEWNEKLPSGVSLRGIKYDVEPYLTDEWKAGGESRQQVMQNYVQCLDKLKVLLDQHGQQRGHLAFGVDIPFWWDKSELEIEIGGQRKPFVNHIQDRVDCVTLMSYRRSWDDVLRLSEQEIGYSRTKNKNRSVGLGLNFRSASGAEEVTTFAGYPQATFRKTLVSLRDALSGNKQVQRIMLHDYASLAKYLGHDAE